MDDPPDICRVCRSGPEPGHPLFHPCRCSGSIRHVHQDCLVEWLRASRKTVCETCGASYQFLKVYDPSMPASLPPRLLALRVVQRALGLALLALRTVVVGSVWLIVVPWMSIWTLRFYLTLGNTVAWTLAGRATLLLAVPSLSDSAPPSPTPPPSSPTDALPTPRSSAPSKPPLSNLLLQLWTRDVYPGQQLLVGIVVCFLCAFLLREWVGGNAGGGEVGEVMGGGGGGGGEEEEVARRAAERLGLREEGGEERPVEADDEDDEVEEEEEWEDARPPSPVELEVEPQVEQPQPLDAEVETDEEGVEDEEEEEEAMDLSAVRRARAKRFDDAALRAPSPAGSARPESPLVAEAAADGPGLLPQDGRVDQGLDAEGSVAQVDHPALESSADADDNHSVADQGLRWRAIEDPTGGGGGYDDDEGDPPETVEVEPAVDGGPDDADAGGAEVDDEAGSDWEDVDDAGDPLPRALLPPPLPPPLVPLGLFDLPQPPPPPPPPAPVGQGPQGLAPPRADAAELDLDDPANAQLLQEEMEGLLEAVGLRGPLVGLLQNSTIITVIVSFFCALAVFVPFVLGKAVLLVNLRALGRLALVGPIQLVRLATDPAIRLAGTYLRTGVVSSDAAEAREAVVVVVDGGMKLALVKGFSDRLTDLAACASRALDQPLAGWVLERASSGRAGEAFAAVGRGAQGAWALGQTLWQAEDIGFFEACSGDEFNDRLVAVAVGYAVVAGLVWLVFQQRGRWALAARAELEPVVTVVKLGVFMLIELIVFPFFCGALLRWSALPLLSDQPWSIASLAIFGGHPIVALGQHVLLGTVFMFAFANLLAFGRTQLRPGVFFFIRDPSDPAFNPVAEVLHKRTWPQLKKLLISAAMYATMLLSCVGLVSATLRLVPCVLPLRWYAYHPVTDIPVDMLALHLGLPILARRYRPHSLLRRALIAWLSTAVKGLRLSSYFFNDADRDGGARHVARDRADTPVKSALDWVVRQMGGWGGRKDFMQGVGGWARVPSKDHLSILPSRRMFVRLDESMAPLNQEELKLLVEINKKAIDNGRNPADDFGVIWLPGFVRNRVYLLLAALWASCLATAVAVLGTLVLGRLALKLVFSQSVHDGYALLVGSLCLAACAECHTLTQTYIRRASRARKVAKHPSSKSWRSTSRKIRQHLANFYGVFALALLVPLAVGLSVEVFVLLPFRSSATAVPVIHLAEVWAVGALSLSCVVRLRPDLPRHSLLRELENAYGHHRFRWNARRLTRKLLGPLLGKAAAAILLPWLAVGLYQLGPSNLAQNAHLSRFAHPLVLLVFTGYYASLRALAAFDVWSGKLREREYLVSMRLRNQGADDGSTIGAQPMAVPPDLVGLLI